MKLKPIESPERLYVRVARRIASLVESGEVKPGDKLPSERDLAEMLQVSRPTIREAMIALEVSGVIDVRTGSGIYVAERATPELIPLTDEGLGPFDILEMRLMFEPEACALAASRITDTQLTELQAIYDEMCSADATPAVEQVDRRFHQLIADATENAAVATSIDWLWSLRYRSGLSRGFHRLILEEGVFPVLEEHKAILDALSRHDPQASRAAMRAHLQASTDAAAEHFGERNIG